MRCLKVIETISDDPCVCPIRVEIDGKHVKGCETVYYNNATKALIRCEPIPGGKRKITEVMGDLTIQMQEDDVCIFPVVVA